MTQRDEYLLGAAELSANAQAESDAMRKAEFENLARAYLRLAGQAERNSLGDIVCETPSKKGCNAQAARTIDAKLHDDKE